MWDFFAEVIEGATAGSMIGGAVGTLFEGVVIGGVIALAPFTAPAAIATTVSCSAAGTLIGGAMGAIDNMVNN